MSFQNSQWSAQLHRGGAPKFQDNVRVCAQGVEVLSVELTSSHLSIHHYARFVRSDGVLHCPQWLSQECCCFEIVCVEKSTLDF